MSPVHLPILPYLSSTIGLCKDVKASPNRWMNAVARITPVPKCFPMKNRIDGIRKKGICCETMGNDTAAHVQQN